ncbi:hypothetical protein [Azospirillum sp. SYSU D00513]|uniref:hypothetical protein n=1 Tax=Azospirillum sp. SYSU D00513 TaxID=2812561 RepID=UPI001A96EFA7|nr:hypothetical protein [Azospirillum sp. SYSU D00513]
MIDEGWISRQRAGFARALDRFGEGRPTLLLAHHDADGLSAAALLLRALARVSRPCETRIVGRGENPWSPEIAGEVRTGAPGGLIVADLGVRGEPVAPGVPTVLIDHHVPVGTPPQDATVISGYGLGPTPSSSLLAHWCAQGLGDVDDLLWLAAVGLIGDYGDKAGFPELAAARKRFGATALRETVSLVNAPRRAASGDASPALALLMKADSPKDLLSGAHPEIEALHRARDEVKAALEVGRKVAPRIAGPVALIRLDSPCQIHPLVAQSWRSRLKDRIVIAANPGYRPGWVHFAARSATGVNLIAFLKDHAPPDAGDHFANGHEQATGGALKPEAWNAFVAGLGFGPEMNVPA